ncbi:tetratricopeptide repeat protein [Dyadobacter sp. CY347]|uniref:tetratricopeptide repeat-containing sensor histidine kinase n=1 Tax=Dyadobacter sp. CY347 TaxID=2909336 RepID=UPI001F3A6527|nr:tetratricopeptide repeat protein [Dyadobacter sp. CY347]MCF2488053.1 tetratricopeptide repeat protein [Dyadobacter sp. CY347]
MSALKNSSVIIQLVAALIILLSTLRTHGQQTKTDSLIRLVTNHPRQDDQRAVMLLKLIEIKLRQDPKDALSYTDEILVFQNKIADKKYVSATYRFRGTIFIHLAEYSQAVDAFNKGMEVDNSIQNELGVAAALANIGVVYVTQLKLPEALKYFLLAQKKHASLKNELNAANISANIGIVYTEMRDYKAAMQSYEKALLAYRKYKHFGGVANVLGNIATLHSKNNNLADAVKFSKSALQIADSIGDLRASSQQTGNLAAYYCKLHDPDMALTYGNSAVEKNRKLSYKKGLGFNFQNLSDAYFQKQNYDQAKLYAFNALNIAKELDLADLKRDASLGLSEAYGALNRPDSAFIYYKQYKEAADSISNDQKKEEITRMGIQYEFDKTEAVYKQKQILADGQLKQQQLQIALNNAELQKGIQQRDLQRLLLDNEKLISEEKQKQLQISKNNEKLQLSKVSALSQQQALSRLQIQQLWLYGILAIVSLASILIYLLNLNRIRKLKYANVLQLQQAEQNTLKLQYQYQLSESELKAIRSQMNPHFIFNVLNSIESYVMDSDKRTASRLIQKFASLSRLILENSTKSLVAADKEWKALQLYTELEAMRYNNSFTYSFDVDAGIDLKTILLPPMLIQPLIENAIIHGIVGSGISDAHIAVAMNRSDQILVIQVSDNGIGLHSKTNNTIVNVNKEESIGLKSISERIKLINAQHHSVGSFVIEEGPNHRGTQAVLKIPLFSID